MKSTLTQRKKGGKEREREREREILIIAKKPFESALFFERRGREGSLFEREREREREKGERI